MQSSYRIFLVKSSLLTVLNSPTFYEQGLQMNIENVKAKEQQNPKNEIHSVAAGLIQRTM